MKWGGVLNKRKEGDAQTLTRVQFEVMKIAQLRETQRQDRATTLSLNVQTNVRNLLKAEASSK